MKNTKLRFADEFKKRLVQKQMSLRAASQQLGLSDGSLRTWVSRNRFPEKELRNLADLVGFDPDRISQDFVVQIARPRRSIGMEGARLSRGVESPSLQEVLDLMDERKTHVARLHPRFVDSLNLFFRSLQQGDVFASLTVNSLPYEWDPVVGPAVDSAAVAEAVKRGAYFIYLTPSDRLLQELDALRIVTFERPDILQQRFRRYLSVVADKLGGEGSKRSRELNAATVAKHIRWYRFDYPCFLIPYARFSLAIPAAVGELAGYLSFPLDPRCTHDLLSPEVTRDLVALFERAVEGEGSQTWQQILGLAS